MDGTLPMWKANCLEIRDLTADVLVLVFSLLRGQDIARCARVCRFFAELVHSNLYLQYKMELAQNGMVDGVASTLPIPDRLRHLRQYASNFQCGIFDHEDLSAHPDYVLQMRNLTWNTVFPDESSFSDLYGQGGQANLTLSVFTPGSAVAGIQSSRHLLPVGSAVEPGLLVTKWAIDDTQDLLVMAEVAGNVMPAQMGRRSDVAHIRFYSFRGSRITRPTPHPAATVPSVHVPAPAGKHNETQTRPAIHELCIVGEHVIWELAMRSVSIGVCNWKTGEVISLIDVGTDFVYVIPLDAPYLLVIPKLFENYPQLSIYTFAPSDAPNHHICTLQLPDGDPEERVVWHEVFSGDRPYTSAGHFHADPSQSAVVLSFKIRASEHDYETHFLIPRATFLAQLQAAASRQTGTNSNSNSNEPDLVPWAQWGPQGCLRLRLQRQPSSRATLVIPFGSRLPLVVFESPRPTVTRTSVYVFDVNPLAARHTLAAHEGDLGRGWKKGPTSIVKNTDDFLLSVVDLECSGIPYVAYRFELPYTPEGHTMIRSVVMSMTGFTVKFSGVEYEKTVQTWTV